MTSMTMAGVNRQGCCTEMSTLELERLVNELFAALLSLFIPPWGPSLDVEALGIAKKMWLLEFQEHKYLTREMVQRGISRSRKRKSPYMPVISEFLALCQPEPSDFGIPSTEEAFQNFSRNTCPYTPPEARDWSHDLIRQAASSAGGVKRLSAMTTKDCKRVFTEHYEKLVAEYISKNLTQLTQEPSCIESRSFTRAIERS